MITPQIPPIPFKVQGIYNRLLEIPFWAYIHLQSTWWDLWCIIIFFCQQSPTFDSIPSLIAYYKDNTFVHNGKEVVLTYTADKPSNLRQPQSSYLLVGEYQEEYRWYKIVDHVVSIKHATKFSHFKSFRLANLANLALPYIFKLGGGLEERIRDEFSRHLAYFITYFLLGNLPISFFSLLESP